MQKYTLRILLLCVFLSLGIYFFAGPLFLSLGTQSLESRNHDRADTLLRIAKKLGGQEPNLSYQLARVSRRMGKLQAADDYLEKAIESGLPIAKSERESQFMELAKGNYPNDVVAWRNLLAHAKSDLPEVCEAFVYFRLSRFETELAMQVLDAWQKEYPTSTKAAMIRGKVCISMEQWSDAIECFESAAQNAPDNFDVRAELHRTQMKRLLYDEALSGLMQLCSDFPDTPEARVLVAECKLRTGNLEDALLVISELEKSPELSSDGLAVFAEIQLQTGEHTDALEHIKRAVKSDPTDREKRYLHARILQRNGRKAEAEREFAYVREATNALLRLPKLTSELTDSPDDINLRFEIARLTWIYHSRKEGMRWFQELLAIAPNHQKTLEFFKEKNVGNVQ